MFKKLKTLELEDIEDGEVTFFPSFFTYDHKSDDANNSLFNDCNTFHNTFFSNIFNDGMIFIYIKIKLINILL